MQFMQMIRITQIMKIMQIYADIMQLVCYANYVNYANYEIYANLGKSAWSRLVRQHLSNKKKCECRSCFPSMPSLNCEAS